MSQKRVCEGAGSSAGGKKARIELLPDPLTLSREKKQVKSAFHAVEALKLFKESGKSLEKLSEGRKLSWAIGKYGWSIVHCVGRCLSSLPCSLTEAQRLNFIEMACPDSDIDRDTLKEISTFLVEQCCDFVSSLASDVVEVLAPPVAECFECGSGLVSYHSCEVKLYTLKGVKNVPKVTLRCQHCQLHYSYSQFGNKHELGFRYYPRMQPIVEVTDTVFVHRRMLELQCSLA